MARESKYELGAVVMSNNPTTSILEEDVRTKLKATGLKLHKGRSAVQCGFEPVLGNHPVLSPDILIKSAKVAVEVDSEYTHGDELAKDILRNQLLNDVGWTVVRLRLGGLQAIGEHDVVCESSGATQAAIVALVQAVEDAVAGRAGTIRNVQKSPTPTVVRRSGLGPLGAHKYYDNAFYISWLDEVGMVEKMVAMDGGNYLATAVDQGTPHFKCWLGLAGTPRPKWRKPLIDLLSARKDFDSVSRFPWGDDLFVGPQADKVNVYSKFNAGGAWWDATSNLDGVDAITETQFTASGEVIAELHQEAVDAGWRLTDLLLATGFRGPYQRFTLVRDGARGGLWASA
jgi:hypothetical protein